MCFSEGQLQEDPPKDFLIFLQLKTGFLTPGNAQRQVLKELVAHELCQLCQCLAGISFSLF